MSLVHAQTTAFTVNATFQAFSAFAYRSADRPIWQLPANPWLYGAAVLALAIHMVAVYWPPFQAFLGTEPLAPWEFGVAVAEGFSLFVLAELYKVFRQHRRQGRRA
jgi:Ca2+-transporting ATPase